MSKRDNERMEGDQWGCFTYVFTGRAGNCIMLPVWRWIGAHIGDLWRKL